jgi:hypothetical protein
MILHTQPGKKWTEEDFLLLEAYQILEDERCSQCGLPRYICHSDDRRIQFWVDSDTCNAKYEVDKRMESVKEPPKGTVLVPHPFMTDDSDFVELRGPYYEAESKRLEALQASQPRW